MTRTTLYRIAAGVTVIIALATGIGYELLSREVGRRVLERLSEYVVQRAKYHGSYLTFIRDHHRVIKAEFLRRYAAPMPDADERFEQLMMRYPDGAWRNRPEYLDPRRYSTGWMHKKAQPTPEFRRLWMLFFDLSEQFARVASTRYANLYFVPVPTVANMGYDNLDVVGEVHWVRDTPADYPYEEIERFKAADPDHDPERVTVWAAPMYDPIYKKYIVGGYAPVDVEGRHVASICTDALMDELVASVVESEIPGATHAVFRGDGRLIADRVHLAKVIKSDDRGVYIADTGDRRLSALLQLVRAQAKLPASGFDRESDTYYAVSRIEGPGWYFASTVPGALVRREAFRSAQWVLWTGIASLALLLAILALILRRQIGKPPQQLLAATMQMRERKALLPLDTARRDELGRLAAAFEDTAQSIEGEFHRRAAALEAEMDERRRSEAALRESEARYHLVAQQTGHLLYDYQIPSGAVRWAGPIADLTGYTDEAFQGLGIVGWEALIHPEDRERAVAELERAQ
ncbi:MAG: PAS domain-containing protein, partial [Gammaproteobacteria bacterium]